MADLSEFQNIAPLTTSIGELTKAQIDTQFAAMPSEPIPVVTPDPTKTATLGLFSSLTAGHSVKKSLEDAGGFAALALEHSVSPTQVKALCIEIEAMHALYLA